MFDVVVVGLGAAGSATVLELARRGLRTAGLDRYRPPHPFGSSHGSVRLTREAYYEDPLYVPLVRRSSEIWKALETEARQPIRVRTGSLMIGAADTQIVRGSLESAHRHEVEHELLDAATIARRFPAVRPPDGMVGVYEPASALLRAEAIVTLQLEMAAHHGASLWFDTPVLAWEPTRHGLRIIHAGGELRAQRVVLAAGAWMPALLRCRVPLAVERQVQHWVHPADPDGAVGAMPVTMWELADGRVLYGMPDVGDGVKLGWHHGGVVGQPETIDRSVAAREVAEIRAAAARYLPGVRGPDARAEVCLYTNTPDLHFVVDRHPEEPRVVLLSACSGHGFKFTAALGEVVADLATDCAPGIDLAPFRLSRFRG